eukprot:9092706-Pyramimonas_sp.AAC.1
MNSASPSAARLFKTSILRRKENSRRFRRAETCWTRCHVPDPCAALAAGPLARARSFSTMEPGPRRVRALLQ